MASLRLVLTDAAGDDLNDHVVVDLFAQQSSTHLQAVARVARELAINQIDLGGGPLYRIMVSPANHRIVQFFVMLNDGETVTRTEAVPIDPDKVVSIRQPAFNRLPDPAQQLLIAAQVPKFNDGAGGFLRGEALYGAVHEFPLLQACLCNIIAKSAATGLRDGTTCLDHYLGLVRLEQDRLFVKTSAGLVEETAHSQSFHQVSAALHEPMPGYLIVSSYKTLDRYGNLQLTFQRRGDTGDDYAVDVDIDDAQGIEHIFQVLRNSVRGPTNPYDIHEILLRQQPPVDPAYSFVFAAAAAA